MTDIDTSQTYTADELAYLFGVSARWIGVQCREGRTLRGYKLRRYRDHDNQPYTYEVGRVGDGDGVWLVCHDMRNVGRWIPVASYSDRFSAEAKARKVKIDDGPAVRLVRWSGEEPELDVKIRASDERIEEIVAV